MIGIQAHTLDSFLRYDGGLASHLVIVDESEN
jgi:hypothetical protein